MDADLLKIICMQVKMFCVSYSMPDYMDAQLSQVIEAWNIGNENLLLFECWTTSKDPRCSYIIQYLRYKLRCLTFPSKHEKYVTVTQFCLYADWHPKICKMECSQIIQYLNIWTPTQDLPIEAWKNRSDGPNFVCMLT